jgi:hypothetical protein
MIVVIIGLMDDRRPAARRVIHRVARDIVFVICFVNCAFRSSFVLLSFAFSASRRSVDSDEIYKVN